MSRVVAEDKVGTYACSVISVRPLNGIIFEIELQSLKDEHLSYKSGQYLALELDVNNDGQVHSLFYTIASRFNLEQPNSLQLIIQKNSEFSSKVIDRLMEALQNQEAVNIALPMGKAFLQTDLRFPHVLIAAGSGISKIKSIAEEILTQRPDAHVRIYWSNRKIDDFFMLSRFHEWSEFHQNLHFTPILESADKKWCGRTGYIYEVIKEDLLDLSDAQTYLCGSPQMVYGTMDELRSEGLKQENCYSDVFEFAPKESKIAV